MCDEHRCPSCEEHDNRMADKVNQLNIALTKANMALSELDAEILAYKDLVAYLDPDGDGRQCYIEQQAVNLFSGGIL